MSYRGDGFSGYSRGGSRRGRRGRGRGNHYYDNRDQHQESKKNLPNDPAIIIPGKKNQSTKKEGAQKIKKAKEKEILEKIQETQKYSKFEMLEMFTSIEFDIAANIMKNFDGLDLIVNHSQNPVLLEEAESELTLEELRPRKGFGGPRKRGKFD